MKQVLNFQQWSCLHNGSDAGVTESKILNVLPQGTVVMAQNCSVDCLPAGCITCSCSHRWAMAGVAGALGAELLGQGDWYEAPKWVSAISLI